MRRKINAALVEVEERYREGHLPWTYKTCNRSSPPYPRRGHLDVLKVGQEDEATPDPDGAPWEMEPDVEGQGDPNDNAEDLHDEVADFDPHDWVSPPEVWALSLWMALTTRFA